VKSTRVRLAGLVIAVAAAAVFLAGSPPQRSARSAAPAAPAPTRLDQAWPGTRPADAPARLPDGTSFTPLLYLDATTAVGSALSPDGGTVRLLVRTGSGTPRELHSTPANQNPQYAGFVASGDEVLWSESTADTAGHGATRLLAANWKSGGPARTLTAEAGDAVFFNSEYDLVVADGAVHWAAAANSQEAATEVRSVPLAGGPVAVRTVPGAYAMSAWPWLVSAGSGQSGPVDLVDLTTGRKVHVRSSQAELVACSPVWCRVLVLTGNSGPARIDLMHPDGSGRQRVAGSQATSSTSDVAILDRFEVLTENSSMRLSLYDVKTKRTVVIADTAGSVFVRGGVLAWSTGDHETLTWHALDLRKLS
jgi:hypothetical protein